MKKIIVLLTVLVSSYAFADGRCPNLNGVFEINPISMMRFTQNNCNTLTITGGILQTDGKIDWYRSSKRQMWINGDATCNAQGCISAKSNANELSMSRDRSWTDEIAGHGACLYNQVTFSIDANNNLKGTYIVYNCGDGYTGPADVVHPRRN